VLNQNIARSLPYWFSSHGGEHSTQIPAGIRKNPVPTFGPFSAKMRASCRKTPANGGALQGALFS
jgi:hypothetical protein